MIYIMKKALVLSLSLFLLCGCASQNIDSSEDKKYEAKTTAVTTTARTTSSSTVTTSHTITTTIATPTSVSADEKEYEPGLFDARDYSDNYVFNDGLKAINSPNFLGKKLEK